MIRIQMILFFPLSLTSSAYFYFEYISKQLRGAEISTLLTLVTLEITSTTLAVDVIFLYYNI